MAPAARQKEVDQTAHRVSGRSGMNVSRAVQALGVGVRLVADLREPFAYGLTEGPKTGHWRMSERWIPLAATCRRVHSRGRTQCGLNPHLHDFRGGGIGQYPEGGIGVREELGKVGFTALLAL
jgi:hypothetical protein